MQPEPGEQLDPKKLFRPIGKIREEAAPLEPLWGDFLFKSTVTSVVGDPGIGKTSMTYSMVKELCLGRPFLEIKADEPIVTLLMDYESADCLISSRSNFVIGDEDVPNFFVYNDINYFLSQIPKLTIDFCKDAGVNLLIIDNQTAAFNTRDENDNSEAARQMRFIRQLTNACGTATLIFHHPSKGNLPGIRKGSGAFARARLADICITLDYPDEEDTSIIRWLVPKNRMVDSKPLWYIKKDEGKFVFTDPPLSAIGKPRKNTVIYKVQQDILVLLRSSNGKVFERQEILAKLKHYEVRTIDEGLSRLKVLGRVSAPRHGYYKAKKLT